MVGESLRLTEHDRLVIPVPLYHCFGMVMGNLGCVTHGTTMIYPSAAFEPLAALQAAAEEKATGMYGVPTMFIAMLDHPERQSLDLSSLRTGIMAGSTCPIEVMKRVIDDMHLAEMQIAYGMTETSPVSTQTSADDDLERRVTSVGRTQPHLESKIVDEHGAVVPRGQIGELCTRGYSVMLGYWNNPDATREAIDGARWMHTGDLAVMDDEGYIKIVGRNKDMIIRGGENVYPREIEEFLFTHPAVADVQVIGVPDSKFGEEIVAWVKLHPGHQVEAEALREFCKGRIAHFKTPRHIKFVDDFPMTISGKVRSSACARSASSSWASANSADRHRPGSPGRPFAHPKWSFPWRCLLLGRSAVFRCPIASTRCPPTCANGFLPCRKRPVSFPMCFSCWPIGRQSFAPSSPITMR